MTIEEFSKVCKDFFATNKDFKGIVHIISNKPDNDAGMIGFSGVKGTGLEIVGMCLIACDKVGVSVREVSAVAKRLANDPEAMKALASINRDGDDDNDEENVDESQEKKECCGECNCKESDKEDDDHRKEIAKMLLDALFGD